MRIQDAKPGDVLRDEDGDVWLRGRKKARCMTDVRRESDGDVEENSAPIPLARAERFGPFTRLVPEVEQ